MKKALLTFFSLLLLYHVNYAQELKREITEDELLVLKEELKSPVEVSLNIIINNRLLEGDYSKNNKEFEQRKQALEEKLSKDPENIDLLIAMSVYYEGEESLKYLQKAINIVEENNQGKEFTGNDYYQVAKILYAGKDYEQSFRAYQKASELIPDTAKIWSQLALFNISMQNLEEARRLAKKALDIDLENIDGQLAYGQSFMMERLMLANEGSDKVIEIDFSYLDKLIAKYPDNKKYEVFRKTYEAMGLFYDLMFVSLGKVNDTEEIDYQNFFNFNDAQLVKLSKLEKYFSKALEKEYADKLFLYDMLGITYLLQNKQEDAVNYFEKSVAQDKVTANRFYNTVFTYGLQKNWHKIIPLIQSKEDIEDLDYALMGMAEHKQDNLQKALEICNKGLQEFFNSSLLLHLKGRIQFDLGNLKESAETLREAMRIAQEDVMISYLQALVALERKKWDNAYNYLQKAEELGHEKAQELKDKYFE